MFLIWVWKLTELHHYFVTDDCLLLEDSKVNKDFKLLGAYYSNIYKLKAMPHGSEKSPAKNRNEICDKSFKEFIMFHFL